MADKKNCAMFLLPMLIATVIASGGCYWLPKIEPPGTEAQQIGRAVLHDPFPNNDIAPPVLGSRPRGFDRPFAEPEANQYYEQRRGAQPNYQGF
jgi:hypothetical protein